MPEKIFSLHLIFFTQNVVFVMVNIKGIQRCQVSMIEITWQVDMTSQNEK